MQTSSVRSFVRRLALAATLAAVAAAARPLHAQATAGEPLTVYVVRHAEKAAEPGSDPALSTDGQARARALADSLRNAGVDAVIVTQFKRTASTAAGVVEATKLVPQVVPASADVKTHVEAVAAAVRKQPAGSTVLVVGHSNTVPAIIAALGGERLPDLCDAEYDNLFVVTVPAAGPTRVARSRYGAPAGADAPACAAMKK